MVNCNECDYINITEEQQTSNKENHVCTLFGDRLFHNSNNFRIEHNYIYPSECCNGKAFKERK